MALVKCPECGKKLSNDCVDCLRCGCRLDNVLIQYGLPNYKRRRRRVAFRVISIVLVLIGLFLVFVGMYCYRMTDLSYERNLYYVRTEALADDFDEKEHMGGYEMYRADTKTLLNYYNEYIPLVKDDTEYFDNYTEYFYLGTFYDVWRSNRQDDSNFKSIIKNAGLDHGYLKDYNSIGEVMQRCEYLKESMNNAIMDYLCSDTEQVNKAVSERISQRALPIIVYFLSGTAFIVVAIILFVKSFKKKYNP